MQNEKNNAKFSDLIKINNAKSNSVYVDTRTGKQYSGHELINGIKNLALNEPRKLFMLHLMERKN